MVIKKTITALLATMLLAVLLAYGAGYGFLITAIQRTYLQGNTTANINDHTAFNTHQIKASTSQPLVKGKRYNQRDLPIEFRQELETYNSVAYLVVRDGEVLAEHYFGGYGDRSKTNSFSMAKTVTTMLLGIAIEEGYIQSLDQSLIDFIPEFKGDPLGRSAKVGQLSLMNSGYEWVEHYYSPVSPTVELLYGSDVEAFLLDGSFTAEPGSFWEYSSASTQLLGVVLKRALRAGGKDITLAEYLSEKLWQPLGMNDDALWHTDNRSQELTFCCLNTNARNYAKLGILLLNNGLWNGQQLIPRAFVDVMVQPLGTSYYGYSTWLSPEDDPKHYQFVGHLGQYIIVVPEHNMVVVRLGEGRDTTGDYRADQTSMYVRQALALTGEEVLVN